MMRRWIMWVAIGMLGVAVVGAQEPPAPSLWFRSGPLTDYGAACPFELYQADPAQGRSQAIPGLPPGNVVDLRWSPDGTQVAFVIDPTGNCNPGIANLDLYVVGADGGGLRQLIAGEPLGALIWSPDGSRLAFNQIGAVSEIVVLEAASGAEVARWPGLAFQWSPDGSRLAFTHPQPDSDLFVDLYIVDVPGGQPRQLTDKPGNIDYFIWQLDGAGVTYSYYELPNNQPVLNLFTVDLTGGDQALTSDGQGPRYFAYSPDASYIAFESMLGEIGLMWMDDGAYQIIAGGQQGYRGVIPAWSPDSRTLAFEAPTDQSNRGYSTYTLHLYDVVSGSLTTPDVNLETETQFTWSPDGRWLAFMARPAEGQVGDVFIVGADGTGLTNLTESPDRFDFNPAWQPLG
jgi:Tol biopolymer transport system component